MSQHWLYSEYKFTGCIYRSSLQACPLTELCPVTNLSLIGEFNAMLRGVKMSGIETPRFNELIEAMQEITAACPLRILAEEEWKK